MSWGAVRTVLVGVPLVFAAWGGLMLALTLFQPAGRPVAVFAPGGVGAAIEAVAAADGYLLQVRGDTVIAVARDSGFVPRLYRAGALVVIAAGAGGCIVVPSATIARAPAV
jgi:hypothetical protein